MPTKPKPTTPKTAQDRMRLRRERLRARGQRPVQHWVPDLRDAAVLARIREEAAELDKHPESDAIDEWLEAVLADTE